jgi:hypothetical protein
MKINSKTWLESATVATAYTIAFYLINWLSFNALLAKYPSQSEDDVRADIGIPAILIAYIVALLCSYVAIFIINKLLHKPFSFKRFIISSSYNRSSYFVYQISLVICTWVTVCIVYWLAFKYRSAQRLRLKVKSS